MAALWTRVLALVATCCTLLGGPASVAAEGVRRPLPAADVIARLPSDGGPEFNRLVFESSPYLRQHARNPVDWYPWGDEALARAKAEDKPIFLSVGYSTCHWCHVMEHESFEDAEIAKILNAHYVAIKVDREERPDLDEIYMTATYILHGSGGWPNSLWLTPDGKPFFAGTYFPRDDGRGRPGFRRLLLDFAEQWKSQRNEIGQRAEQTARRMRQNAVRTGGRGTGDLDRSLVDRAIEELERRFDARHGGFSRQPKFPPHRALELLLYEHRRRGHARALEMAIETLDEMAMGGIHDHVGGGFHRYSTDARWFAPHFEKMLYDNAQLGRAYVDAHAITGDTRHRWVAEGIYDWVLREMTDERGGFHSALDADSEGIEGKYYLWTHAEVTKLLGSAAGSRYADLYNVVAGGNWAPEELRGQPTNIAHLRQTLDVAARERNVPPAALHDEIQEHHAVLRDARAKRIPPGLDDKVLTAWNGLMLGSMAHAGKVLEVPRYVAAAKRAADFVLDTLRTPKGGLQRSYRDGTVKLGGYLEDYAYLADGLLDVHEATGEQRYLDAALELARQMHAQFWDERGGGYWFTAHGHEKLLARTKDPFDNAIPAANGIAARLHVRLGQLTDDASHFERARATMDAFAGAMNRSPRGTASLVTALAMLLDGKGESLRAPEPGAPKWGTPDASARRRPVRVEAFAEHGEVPPRGSVRVAVRLAVDDGWHVNSNAPLDAELIPTRIGADAAVDVDVAYPGGRTVRLGFSDQPVSVYEGESWLLATVSLPRALEAERVTLDVRYQACNDERCLRPETLSLPLPLTLGTQVGPPRHARLFDTLQWTRAPAQGAASIGPVGLGLAAFGLLTLVFVMRRRA